MAFSPDGKQVLTGSHDQTARLWDVVTGKELSPIMGHDYKAYVGMVTSVAFSPNGKLVLTGSWNHRAGCGTSQAERYTAPSRGIPRWLAPWRSRRTASWC